MSRFFLPGPLLFFFKLGHLYVDTCGVLLFFPFVLSFLHDFERQSCDALHVLYDRFRYPLSLLQEPFFSLIPDLNRFAG